MILRIFVSAVGNASSIKFSIICRQTIILEKEKYFNGHHLSQADNPFSDSKMVNRKRVVQSKLPTVLKPPKFEY